MTHVTIVASLTQSAAPYAAAALLARE
ncbi:MAG: hypothetical protein RJB60_1191, partial [Pseudomonadota bacterium]